MDEFAPFLTPGDVADIDAVLKQAFATRRELGNNVALVFERDTNDDGTVQQFVVTNVLVSFAAREPAASGANAPSRFMGQDGIFEHESPFNIQVDDRGRLPANLPNARGQAFRVTMVLPTRNGVTKALFTLQG